MSDKLLVDIYEGDGVEFAVEKVIAAGDPWIGIMVKVSQGTYYAAPKFLDDMWPRCANAGDRYGKTWFRIPYVYVDFGLDGAAQAEFAFEQVEDAGGLGKGDPFFVIDVERGAQRVQLTRDRIVAAGRACSERLRALTGRKVICYGGELLREQHVTINDLDCDAAWVADYETDLPANVRTGIGLPCFAWQYGGKNGDGSEAAKLAGYPHTTPAGNADVSAVIINGGGEAGVTYLANCCA